MRLLKLVQRSLVYYLKTDLVIAAGIAVAIAALTGSLLVGNSVKKNLLDISLQRLNSVRYTVVGKTFFSEGLAGKLGAERKKEKIGGIIDAVIILPALVKNSINETLVPDAVLLGVKENYWRKGSATLGLQDNRDAVINEVLAGDLNAQEGDYLVVKLAKSGFAPGDSLFGGKSIEDTMQSFTVIIKKIIKNDGPAGFSLKSEVTRPRNMFVNLKFLQQQINKKGRVNCLLISGVNPFSNEELQDSLGTEDLGVKFISKGNSIILESENMVLSDAVVIAAEKAAQDNRLACEKNSVYLLNSINKKAPYSVVFGNSRLFPGEKENKNNADAPIILGSWAAEDLGARIGDVVTVEYFETKINGEYGIKTGKFVVINIEDQDNLAQNAVIPDFEGMTDAKNMAGWKTPFPVDLKKIRQKDELFWDKYKAAPKAMVTFNDAKKFWQPAYSGVTSVKVRALEAKDISGFKRSFLEYYGFKEAGLRVTAVKEQALKASQGSTDYSMLFVSLSFIIVLSALWLAAYLFRLMLEARTFEAGILRAFGFSYRDIFWLYSAEGLFIILLGALLSLPVSIFYAGWVLKFLKPLLGEGADFKIYIDAWVVVAGLASGGVLSLLSIFLGVRVYKGKTVKGLLSGRPVDSMKLKIKTVRKITSLYSLGIRSLFYSKKRSLLTAGLFASAAFIIITVAVNRPLGFSRDTRVKNSGSGGFNLLARSKLPLFSDLNTVEGRKKCGFASYDSAIWENVDFVSCKLNQYGDDISCLNINRPLMPLVLGLPFSAAVAKGYNFSSGKKVDWALYNGLLPDGKIPALADANSLQWILHKSIGDSVPVYGASGSPAELKFTASLSKSIFADVVVVSLDNFNKVFGSDTGYNYFLVRVPGEKEEEISLLLRRELGKSGYTVTKTSEILSSYANVQNTYLYTFQILGGIGFLLGTFGIIAVLLQNVYERRQQFALKAAIGFKKRDLVFLVAFENALLLIAGLFTGTVLSLLVSLPYIWKMGNSINFTLPFLTLLGMLIIGLVSSSLAAYYSLKGNLLSSLRAE